MKRLSRKVSLCFIILPLLALLSASDCLAHKVDLFVSAAGGMVHTESYYPDGKAVENGKIEVLDSQENKLLEGTTDSAGKFSFKIPKKDDLKIVLDASLGHKTSTFIFTEELEAGLEKAPPAHDHAEDPGQAKTPAKVSPKRPISKKEPFPVAAVLGGLGFIFGLTALIMQLANKKKDE